MRPDKITVLSRVPHMIGSEGEHELVTEHGIVAGRPTVVGGWRWTSVDGAYKSSIAPYDEGVGWIRGHHDADSAEVAALRVAYALR